MDKFRRGQRVKVIRRDLIVFGMTGIVYRLLRRSEKAWVRIDERIPEGAACFGPLDQRRNDVCLWPEECKLLEEASDDDAASEEEPVRPDEETTSGVEWDRNHPSGEDGEPEGKTLPAPDGQPRGVAGGDEGKRHGSSEAERLLRGNPQIGGLVRGILFLNDELLDAIQDLVHEFDVSRDIRKPMERARKILISIRQTRINVGL